MDAVTVSVNHGGQLRKLFACEAFCSAFEKIVVVDNGSTDDSRDVAARAGAVVIETTTPVGYGSCVNLGVGETTGPRFAVINPDITFDESDLVGRLERHFDGPQVGVVAPTLVLPDGRAQGSARHVPTPVDLVVRRWFANDRGAIYRSGEVPWVVGAFLIVSRDAWEAVGGFDERYFLYFEDVDLCLRMREAGWLTYLDSEVDVHHEHGGGSRQPIWRWHTRMHLRSAARFYRDNPRFLMSRSVPPLPDRSCDEGTLLPEPA